MHPLKDAAQIVFWMLPFAVLSSFGLTLVLRSYALRHNVIDIPNERSSHVVPVPRGGGLAIVLTFLGCIVVLWAAGVLSARPALATFGAGGWVALIGWIDDRYNIPARWRFLGHLLAAAWALYWLGAPSAGIVVVTAAGFWVGQCIALLYVVWLLNLYNFMDGIDAIASIEAITVCGASVVLYAIAAPGHELWVTVSLLGACVSGFLFWNFPPARVFLGDTGSGFLGVCLAIFSLQAGLVAPRLFWCWTILLGVFVVDATVTLLRRVLRGSKFYVAHRSHAYQYASRRLGKHKPVALAVGTINLLWLLPIASLVASNRLVVGVGLTIAYTPLLIGAYLLKAGAEEQQ